MSRSREPFETEGENSRVKKGTKRKNTKETALTPADQGREQRTKIKRIYRVLVSVSMLLILVFSFLLANKLKKSGAFLDPEASAVMRMTIPNTENTEAAGSESSESIDTTETDPEETDFPFPTYPYPTLPADYNYGGGGSGGSGGGGGYGGGSSLPVTQSTESSSATGNSSELTTEDSSTAETTVSIETTDPATAPTEAVTDDVPGTDLPTDPPADTEGQEGEGESGEDS
ncbi:MAG: hypothetical protein GX681_01190 [Clostridiaceae bacterium]|nr:hypothetical protein [Clostridiaceae bacterium]